MTFKGMAQAAEEARAGIRFAGAAGVLAMRGSLGLSKVAGSSSANVVDGSVLDLLLAGCLALEFFVEGEHGFLGAGVDVPCSSSAAAELGISLWETGFEEAGWAASSGSFGGLWCLECVSGAATAGMDEFAGGWVGLSDGVS